jgi:hypothetical protein
MRCCAFSGPALGAFAGLTRSAVVLRFCRRLMGGLETNYPRWKLHSHGPLHTEQRASAVRSSPGAPRNTQLIRRLDSSLEKTLP